MDETRIKVERKEKQEDATWESRDFEKHIKGSFEIKKGNEGWEGKTAQVKSDPLIDAGTGKPYLLRSFQFKINPLILHTPTKQELFNYHWQQIRTTLWGDGLRWREDVNPRIVINKKNLTYTIFILCEPRLGAGGVTTMFNERPKTLQEITSKKK